MSFSSTTKKSWATSAEHRHPFMQGVVDEVIWEDEAPETEQMNQGTTDLEASHGPEPIINDLDVAEPALLARKAKEIKDKRQAAEDASARKRLRLSKPTLPKLCAFGFLYGTDQPQMVGSIQSDTFDWQSVLILDAGDVTNLPSLTLLIRHAAVPRQVPINYNLKEHLEFSLQWPLFDVAKEETILMHSMKLYSFRDWYIQATSTIQALPVLQKIRSDPEKRCLTVVECLMGSLPSFQHFPDFRSWDRLPDEVKAQLLKARDGHKIMTFVIDAKNLEVFASLVDF
ncbi:MAG: hypothetical protein Q9198_001895 [Flavoplaca austrocitrina]